MASKNNSKLDHSKGEELSPLNKAMGLSNAEIHRELTEIGYAPEDVVEQMRSLGAKLSAKYAIQVERERAIITAPLRMDFPIFQETVAAGQPEWTGVTGKPSEASLFSVLTSADPASCMWARVSGWSMRDLGIFDGDVVLVDRKREPKEGDVVLAHLAGQGQLIKRLRIIGGDKAVLESANPDFPAITVNDPATMKIHGVVVGRAGTL